MVTRIHGLAIQGHDARLSLVIGKHAQVQMLTLAKLPIQAMRSLQSQHPTIRKIDSPYLCVKVFHQKIKSLFQETADATAGASDPQYTVPYLWHTIF
jgi:hypothetical protein